ncbi:unnamed protein product [Paramecium sonneborni]|uniref:Heat shock protein 70 n=1 Tax=Paramecium sonneborni TaxID=65129 RepID=A0A8S1NWF8_9CILI|nr:unnamed protein product [Paramecium sonneborni]
MQSCYSLGIDLGRSNSYCGLWINDSVEIILNEFGNRQTPSYVAFTENECLIGQAALDQIHNNPLQTIFNVKDLMGRRFSDQSFQKLLKELPYQVEPGIDDKPMIVVKYKKQIQKYFPTQISSMILQSLMKSAELQLGKPISDVVIVVPSQFNDLQRQALKEVGISLGLKILRIINEPSAAAIAYDLNKITKQEQLVIIFDFGGRKLDITLLLIEDGFIELKANSLYNQLGGIYFDNKITEYFCNQILKQRGIDIRNNKELFQKLLILSEQAKKALSSTNQTTMEINDFMCTITQDKFETLCMNMFKESIQILDQFLKDLNISKNHIDEIILVGGSSNIPIVQKLLQEYFDGKQLKNQINPNEVIVFGAAKQAALLNGQICEKIQFTCVFDVTILSFGVETSGGLFTTLITRNTTIPTKKSQIFTTLKDYQTNVLIKIYIGQRYMAKDCLLLGQFNLTGITPAPKGIPQILITFEIDQNHILKIIAEDLTSKKSNTISISNSENSLTVFNIQQIVMDAEKFLAEDQINKNLIEAKTILELIIYILKNNCEKLLVGISDNYKSKLESSIKQTIAWIHENPNCETIKYQNKFYQLEELQNELLNQLLMEDNEQQKTTAWLLRTAKFSLEEEQLSQQNY